MKRASNTFSVLQAIAVIVAFAIILWLFGVPSLSFVKAANITAVSDTLSDTAPGVAASHTIKFVTPTGVAAFEDIVITFENATFDLSTIGQEDIDLLEDGVTKGVGAQWVVSTTSSSITISSTGVGIIASGSTVTVLIGRPVTNDGSPGSQIVNPANGSYEITVAAGSADTGSTRVAIVDLVTDTAPVDTRLTFTVDGVAAGSDVNGETTCGDTTASTIPFELLTALSASSVAQDLAVVTNVPNGFVVAVQTHGQLSSASGADIDGYRNGDFESTPVAWESPSKSLGSENTYGHWGLTTDDDTLSESLTNPFNVGGGGNRFVSASSTPIEVFRHNGPSNGVVLGQGTARVGYKVEISALQEVADDYSTTLVYIATPIF